MLTLNEMILDFNENKLRQWSGDLNRGVMALDVNGVGVASWEEFETTANELIAEIDGDGDGRVRRRMLIMIQSALVPAGLCRQ